MSDSASVASAPADGGAGSASVRAFRRLETPNKVVTKTISTIYAEFLTGSLGPLPKTNLAPSYQRAPCWKQNQNCRLIDSIMCNWPVPILTFYKIHPSDDPVAHAGGARFECVDGQNRLRAIAAFLTGKPIINDKGKPETVFWTRPTDGARLSYSELSAEERGWFDEYDMAVTIIQSPMTLDERKAMFTRLQDGSKITRSEYLKNTEHPVSQYVSRAGLRDKFLPVGKGLMAGVTQWMDVFTDCVTLWINRDTAVPLDYLNRSQSDLRAVLKGEKVAAPDTPCYMPFTEEDDAAVTPLFDTLFDALSAAKTEKVKCHKFHITLLFLHLLRGGAVPAPAILRFWFKETFKGITADTKAEKPDAAIRAGLWEAFQAAVERGESGPESAPRRRPIPKSHRLAVWGTYFRGCVDGVCQCCKAPLKITGSWHQAHIVAVANGGLDVVANLVPTCATCNLECATRDLREFCAASHPDAPFLARLRAAAEAP